MFSKKLLVAGALTLSALAGMAPSAMADGYGRDAQRYENRDNRGGDARNYNAPRYDQRNYNAPRYDQRSYNAPRYDQQRYDNRDNRRDYDHRYDDRRYDDRRYDDRGSSGNTLGAGIIGGILGALLAR